MPTSQKPRPAPATSRPGPAPVEGLNVTVLRGRLSRPPTIRELPSGATLWSLDLTIPVVDGPDETVPVAWFDPPAGGPELHAGDRVLVTGRVRRRFFRAGGATASRTEVQATEVLATRRRRAVRAALRRAVGALTAEA